MKKVWPIFSFILLFAFGGLIFNYLFFLGHLQSQKQEFRLSSYRSYQVSTVEINAADLYKNKNGIEWRESNSEISVNGNYFEVVRLTTTGDKVKIEIIKDEKENLLTSSFFSSQKKNDVVLFNLLKLFFNLCLNTAAVQSPINTVACTASKIRSFSEDWLDQQCYFKTIKPPIFRA